MRKLGNTWEGYSDSQNTRREDPMIEVGNEEKDKVTTDNVW